ncbi:hypothetical protein AC626_08875 [Pseudoalteromonas rubra]|uniref:Uncharacterized protein n=1 Tax=Pseudoalteromonas rubra TaxID=43658 RepID=A0A0L0EV49_9GAMM|nr:hypothetical protein AC626_08875 [Pseudoalteromonas rubra]
MIDTVLKLLPLKVRIFIYFYLKHGYFMSWSKPELFSEYIQLRKLRLGKKKAYMLINTQCGSMLRKK